jgi:hypothetical protein
MSLQSSDPMPYVRGYRKTGRAIRTQAGEGRVSDFVKGKYGQAKSWLTSDAVKEAAKKLLLQGLNKGAAVGLNYAKGKLGSGSKATSVGGRRKKKAPRRSRK